MFTKKHLFIKLLPLIIAMIVFVSFGLYHLTKFETIDEHFWKYDRIEKYSTGIKEGFTEGIWKKTRVNDKPGVTVAMLSTLGLPFVPDPDTHRDVEREVQHTFIDAGSNNKERSPFELYKTDITETINLGFRLPILLFTVFVMLPLLFWLAWRAIGWKSAAVTILLIGTSPILIGISQIINPDALLWSFSGAALFAFMALLKTGERKFIVITGLCTGLALLSKYTANMLFIFYPVLFLLHLLYEKASFGVEASKDVKESFGALCRSLWPLIRHYVLSLAGITLIAWITVSLLMPAVIQKPQHFLYATTYSPVLAPLVDSIIGAFGIGEHFFLPKDKYRVLPMALLSFSLFALWFAILPAAAALVVRRFPRLCSGILKAGICIVLLVFLVSLFNAWTNASLFSLDNLKEVSREEGKLAFPQFADDPAPLFWSKALLVQFQNFVFSLHPIAIIVNMMLWVLLLFNKARRHRSLLTFITLTPLLFFGGALVASVFVNVRYGIMLYPLFALSTAIGLVWGYRTVETQLIASLKKHQNAVRYGIPLIIAFSFLAPLFANAPHYFTYTNSLLPKKYVVTDAWGYGFYEAAQYLNSLPDAENLIVWMDRSGVCQFFIGKCITSREIYLDYLQPDYLIITRRGAIIKPFVPVTQNPMPRLHPNDYYIPEALENPEQEILLNDRPGNFVKILKVR